MTPEERRRHWIGRVIAGENRILERELIEMMRADDHLTGRLHTLTIMLGLRLQVIAEIMRPPTMAEAIPGAPPWR